MPIPIEQVGIYAGSGGVIVAVAMKLLPFLFKKCNGNNKKYNGNNKPGKEIGRASCRERVSLSV